MWIIYILLFVVIVIFRLNYPKIKGFVGESYIKKMLKKLDPNSYKVFNDVYVPTKDGTTQVDHIVISPFGIFVIETKHYNGWIFGSEKQRYWTQVIYKRKEKLFNPIWQNKGHIQALSEYLNMDKNVFHSIVAFSGQSTFKFKEPFQQADVIYFHELIRTIRSKASTKFNHLEMKAINKKIENLIITDPRELRQVRKQHVKLVKDKKSNNKKLKQSSPKTIKKSPVKPQTESKRSKVVTIKEKQQVEPCPKCGGELIERKGKYGKFLGCSNYPTCKYTEKSFSKA